MNAGSSGEERQSSQVQSTTIDLSSTIIPNLDDIRPSDDPEVDPSPKNPISDKKGGKSPKKKHNSKSPKPKYKPTQVPKPSSEKKSPTPLVSYSSADEMEAVNSTPSSKRGRSELSPRSETSKKSKTYLIPPKTTSSIKLNNDVTRENTKTGTNPNRNNTQKSTQSTVRQIPSILDSKGSRIPSSGDSKKPPKNK